MSLPTLRRELISAFALALASVLAVVWAGAVWLAPGIGPRGAVIYVTVLIVVDVGAVALLARYWLRRRVDAPLEQMVDSAEAISRGDVGVRLPEVGTRELARVATAVNHMAERLIADRRGLAANIRSLEETNRTLMESRDALVHAEKMASVGRLGAGIAHEVGNPLGAILGYLGILGRHVGGSDRDLVRAAELEARRIDRIVSGLLEYSRPRESRCQPIDVNTVVRESLELLGMEGRFNGLDLRDRLQRELPRVLADPFQLQQVLVNLFVNATDALGATARPWLMVETRVRVHAAPPRPPARGRDDPPDADYSHRRRFDGRTFDEDPITPSGRVAPTPRDVRRAGAPVAPTPREMRRAGGPVVEIVVMDNGPGVPPEMVEQIFEPFVTTKEPGQGTGLGLAVCARLIDAMGGNIRVDTRTGGGARFAVILPALAPEQRVRQEPGRPPQIDA